MLYVYGIRLWSLLELYEELPRLDCEKTEQIRENNSLFVFLSLIISLSVSRFEIRHKKLTLSHLFGSMETHLTSLTSANDIEFSLHQRKVSPLLFEWNNPS